LAGIDPPVSFTLDGVVLTMPLTQVVLAFGVAATNTPLGNVSVSGAIMLAGALFALLKVIVIVEVPPAVMVAGVKDLPTVGLPVAGTVHTETMLVSIVTAAVDARALPEIVAPVVSVMLALARMFPTNVVFVPIVAELPTCQNTLQFCAPLISTILELDAVVSVLAILKIQTEAGLFWPSRVSVPVSPAEAAAKQ